MCAAQVDDSASLLRQYVRERSDGAFAEIVRRYVDLVYASARRQVRDAELANDVTQAVFLVLAQKAGSVSTDRPLSAWLLRTTTYCAANARRAREHRQFHERKAAEMARDTDEPMSEDQPQWEQLAPLLDEGLNKLGAGERDAVILKYFEKKSLRQVGETLGISEEAATKRVSRAVERLRVFFQKRGAVVSGVALASLLASESAKAAPVGLAKTIASSTATTSAASVAKGAMVLMATQKAKAVAATAAAVVLGVAGVIVFKSISAPKQHANLALPTVVVPKSMTKTRWAMTFSDGSNVEVLGICDPDAKTPQWWAVDGSDALVPDLKGVPLLNMISEPGQAKRRMVLRMTGPAIADHSLSIRLTPTVTMVTSGSRNGNETIYNCALAVPVNMPTTALNLGLGRGPWKIDEALNVDTAAPANSSAANSAPAQHLLKVHGDGAQTAVDIVPRIGDADRQERIYLELQNGKQFDVARTAAGAGNFNTLYFDCPLSSVVRVVRATRPYEWVNVTNVSLFPTGQLTNVKIERPAAPSLTQATP